MIIGPLPDRLFSVVNLSASGPLEVAGGAVCSCASSVTVLPFIGGGGGGGDGSKRDSVWNLLTTALSTGTPRREKTLLTLPPSNFKVPSPTRKTAAAAPAPANITLAQRVCHSSRKLRWAGKIFRAAARFSASAFVIA